MTRNDPIFDTTPLPEVIDRAVATYGPIPVILRAILAAFRSNRPPPVPDVGDLPDYLRRDVGLDPRVTRQPPGGPHLL